MNNLVLNLKILSLLGQSFRGQTGSASFHHVKRCIASKFNRDYLFRASCIRKVCTSSAFAFLESIDGLSLQQSKPYQLTEEVHVDTQPLTLETNYQLKGLVKAGHLNDARQMFDRLSRRDEITWTTMISGYVNASDPTEASALFSNMWADSTLQMDPFALSLALKACAANLDTKNGESIHGYCVKIGLWSSVFVGSSLLDMYMKVGKLGEGCRVFEEMPIRNVVSWTAIITGLVRAGCSKEGLAYFSEMWRSGVQCDSYAFAIALKACADAGFLNYGKEIHTHTIKRGFDVGSFVANTLATMYNKCGKLSYGLCLFEKMSTPDVVSWTSIITTYVQMGQESYAFEAFLRMRQLNTCPNAYTFAAVISGCANVSRISLGEQLHAHVLHVGHLGYLSVANSVMTMYSKCGHIRSSSMVFDEMTQRDIVSWSTIIAGYAQGGYGEEAFELLSRMRTEGPKPTESALASVLSVCGNMAILDKGKKLHAHVVSIGLVHTTMIRSALINMYSKCGSITEASKVFNMSENDDIISWTAMINGYAEHGSSQEAINLFNRLHVAGLRPDSVTFIGVLSACSHAGLVDLGFQYFDLMSNEYKISPSKEHYGCTIDLLCRAGRLSEAEQMINSMPFERDDVVWSTLLRACRVHGDVECGKRTAERILELDPNCAGAHITLANIYSAKGRWREAAEVRKIMRSKGVIKEPGWSWIKVKDLAFAFVAGDRSHPQSEDIYGILDLVGSRVEFALMELDSLVGDVED